MLCPGTGIVFAACVNRPSFIFSSSLMLAAYSFLRSILTLSGHAPGAAQQMKVGIKVFMMMSPSVMAVQAAFSVFQQEKHPALQQSGLLRRPYLIGPFMNSPALSGSATMSPIPQVSGPEQHPSGCLTVYPGGTSSAPFFSLSTSAEEPRCTCIHAFLQQQQQLYFIEYSYETLSYPYLSGHRSPHIRKQQMRL